MVNDPRDKFAYTSRRIPPGEEIENNPHLKPENDDFLSLCDNLDVREDIQEQFLHLPPGQLDIVVGLCTSERPEDRVKGYEALGVQPNPEDLKKVHTNKEERLLEVAELLGISAPELKALSEKKDEKQLEEEEDYFLTAVKNKPRADAPAKGPGRGVAAAFMASVTGPPD